MQVPSTLALHAYLNCWCRIYCNVMCRLRWLARSAATPMHRGRQRGGQPAKVSCGSDREASRWRKTHRGQKRSQIGYSFQFTAHIRISLTEHYEFDKQYIFEKSFIITDCWQRTARRSHRPTTVSKNRPWIPLKKKRALKSECITR